MFSVGGLTRKQLWLRCLEPQIVFSLVNMLLDYFHTKNEHRTQTCSLNLTNSAPCRCTPHKYDGLVSDQGTFLFLFLSICSFLIYQLHKKGNHWKAMGEFYNAKYGSSPSCFYKNSTRHEPSRFQPSPVIICLISCKIPKYQQQIVTRTLTL